MSPLLRYLLTAWLAVTLTFIALRAIPGDAIESQLRQSGTSPQDIATQQEALGLNDPLPIQYVNYLADLLRGDFGISLITRERVVDMIAARLMPTIELAALSLLVAVMFGILMGSAAAFRINPFLQQMSSGIITLSLATPSYWTATLAIYIVSRYGLIGINTTLLPALVLGFAIGGGIARITESSLRQTMQQPFTQTAYAKGLGWWGIYRHALRASLPPILSIIALQAGFLLGGTVIIEIIFTRRGLGSLLHKAVLDQDYPVVQALVLLAALSYALTRILAGYLIRRADPRITAPEQELAQ